MEDENEKFDNETTLFVSGLCVGDDDGTFTAMSETVSSMWKSVQTESINVKNNENCIMHKNTDSGRLLKAKLYTMIALLPVL